MGQRPRPVARPSHPKRRRPGLARPGQQDRRRRRSGHPPGTAGSPQPSPQPSHLIRRRPLAVATGLFAVGGWSARRRPVRGQCPSDPAAPPGHLKLRVGRLRPVRGGLPSFADSVEHCVVVGHPAQRIGIPTAVSFIWLALADLERHLGQADLVTRSSERVRIRPSRAHVWG